MWKWFICVVKHHDWFTWYDPKFHRNRTACERCGAEKSKMLDTDINPNFF